MVHNKGRAPMTMRIKVESHAGHRAEERPLRFTLQGRAFEVREILDRWYGPDHAYFKVRADDTHTYILKYSSAEDEWSLDVFQRNPEGAKETA